MRSYHPTVHSTTNPPRPPTARVLPPGAMFLYVPVPQRCRPSTGSRRIGPPLPSSPPAGPQMEEGGAARSASRTPKSRAPAHANAALSSRFWHAHALPRHHVSTAATRIPPLAPSSIPVDPHRGRPHRRPCESGLLPRLSLPPGSDLHPQQRSLYVPVPYRPCRIT